MYLHEYQGKEVLRRYGIPTLSGRVATSAQEAGKAFEQLGAPACAVKAQVHAGGRGKAGGIKVVRSAAAARDAAGGMLGQTLVTPQTGAEGKPIASVLVEEGAELEKEYYLGVVLDRCLERPVVMACAEGGVEIEEVAARSPQSILKATVHPTLGLQPYQARLLAYGLKLPAQHQRTAVGIIMALAKVFVENDLTLIEINPLALTKEKGLVALDAKMNVDDRGLYRHKQLLEYRDIAQEDMMEVKAGEAGLSYVSLDGDIGCMVNGAGLAMSTMDLIMLHGGNPANFLDVGGGADKDQVTTAFKLLLDNPRLRAVLVNIFGGIMKCDVIARGVVEAVQEVGIPHPLVVRLEGTNAEEGRRLLAGSGLKLVAAEGLDDAARKAVEASRAVS